MNYSDFFKTHLHKFKLSSLGQGLGLCPLHEDHNPSFSCNIETGLWICHGCSKSGNIYQLAELLGVSLYKEEPLQEISRYIYEDENRKPLFQVRRYHPKTFRQFSLNADGSWIPGLNGTSPILYKLPEILNSSFVYIVEGEKDVETLWTWGLPATCNPMGAGKWKKEYSEVLRDKLVVIIPDKDEVGKKHAEDITQKLCGIAKAIKLVFLPKGKDISEWKELGGTKEEIISLVKNTPLLTEAPSFFSSQKNNSSNSTTLKLITLKDLLAEPEEVIDWVVKDLLPKGGLSLIVAKPKTGKSTLARQLALAIARGESFLDRETEQGLVLYLALEERRNDVRSHFKSMGACEEENLKIFAGMAPADALEQVRSLAEKEKPLLIVVDTLARLTRIKDLNDYSQVITGLQPLLAIAREVGSHVCLLHHSKKGESRGIDSALGSIGIVGTVDTIIEINRTEKYRTISSIQRTGEDLPETVLNFDKETRISSLGGSREQCEVERLGGLILEFLNQQEGAVLEKGIDSGVEGKTIHKRKALRLLLENKQIERFGRGEKNSPYLYTKSSPKNACSLVPQLYEEQGNKNPKSNLNTQKEKTYACSQDFQVLENNEKFNRSREQAFLEQETEDDLKEINDLMRFNFKIKSRGTI